MRDRTPHSFIKHPLSDRYGYALAVTTVSITVALRLALRNILLDKAPFSLFILPILFAAILGSFRPALLAVILSPTAAVQRHGAIIEGFQGGS